NAPQDTNESANGRGGNLSVFLRNSTVHEGRTVQQLVPTCHVLPGLLSVANPLLNLTNQGSQCVPRIGNSNQQAQPGPGAGPVANNIFQSVGIGLKLIRRLSEAVRQPCRLGFLSPRQEVTHILERLWPKAEKLPRYQFLGLDASTFL